MSDVLIRGWAYNHADPNVLIDDLGRPYSADPNYYQPMCVACHRVLDRP